VSETLKPALSDRAEHSHAFSPLGWLRRLYDWTLSWADSKWGPSALGGLAFAESSLFPIPPDPLLMALTLGRPERWWRFAALCTVFSVVGAVGGYLIGFYLWQALDQFFFTYVPGFTPENFQAVQIRYDQNAFLAIFAAAFTPIPFKVFTVASGVFEVSLTTLLVASTLGRGLRFFAVAGLIGWLGRPAKDFIDRHFNWLTVVFFVLVVLGFWMVGKFFR
jgi:membrane protein YqaA with SNARE-associated domain